MGTASTRVRGVEMMESTMPASAICVSAPVDNSKRFAPNSSVDAVCIVQLIPQPQCIYRLPDNYVDLSITRVCVCVCVKIDLT